MEQLEQLLAQKCLEKEKEQLDSSVVCVAAIPDVKADVVGQVINIDVEIGGVIIPTMVDTGAQSTIISRDTLHRVVRKMKEDGKTSTNFGATDRTSLWEGW